MSSGSVILTDVSTGVKNYDVLGRTDTLPNYRAPIGAFLGYFSDMIEIPVYSNTIVPDNKFNFNLQYKSTKEITQYEILCNVNVDEFNISTNPTLLDETKCNESTLKLKDFTTDDSFSPYITTIGLYNDLGDLLVVGKLSKPFKKNTKINTTFVVRFDY